MQYIRYKKYSKVHASSMLSYLDRFVSEIRCLFDIMQIFADLTAGQQHQLNRAMRAWFKYLEITGQVSEEFLNQLRNSRQNKKPIYETLTEKVERILKLWKEKTKDYDKIYKEAAQIVNEIQQLQSRQKQLGFTNLQYSILLALENQLGTDKNLTEDAKELTALLKPHMFKGWQTQQTARKTIERETHKYLRKYIKQHALTLPESEKLYQKILESVKTYG